MTIDDKMNYMAGELVAITAFLRALASTHPDRSQLAEEFEQRVQMALAATMPTTVTETYLDGLHARADSLRP